MNRKHKGAKGAKRKERAEIAVVRLGLRDARRAMDYNHRTIGWLAGRSNVSSVHRATLKGALNSRGQLERDVKVWERVVAIVIRGTRRGRA